MKIFQFNFKVYRVLGLLFATIIILAFSSFNNDTKNKLLIQIVTSSLNQAHYQPQEIDDKLSEKIYKIYLQRLDYSKRFLIKEDIDKFELQRHAIDDQIRNSTFLFFNLSSGIIEQRIKEAEAYYKEVLAEPFDFTKKEEFEFDADKRDYAKSKEELKTIWRKMLKYQTLIKLVTTVEVQESLIESKDTSLVEKSFEEMEADAREKIRASQETWFKRMLKINEDDRFSTYINSYTSAFGPHTSFFPPKDKENFDISMSGRLEGIGATLSENDGYVKVVRIVPGSASWLQGDLKANHLILKVAQGSNDPVDIVDMRLDEAVQLIRGKKGTEVRLTVKKLDGSITVIPIIRDIVVIEETYAKAAILTDDNDEAKTGYIYLPKFYTDFNRSGGPDCAKDVEKAIKQLKDENINGLILDLRNNGGGSLPSVVEMGGLFIKDGPIVQVKSRLGNSMVLRDRDSKIQYDGPLIIMVNSYSASASEILAAAMQDYKRAVIIGSNSTFGKGTVQRFFNIDNFVKGYNDIKPFGSIKITTQKFYRVNGGATQLNGVKPDIILADAYQYLDIGEKEHDYVMPWDEIQPEKYDLWNGGFDINDLKAKSEIRTKKNKTFALVDEKAESLKGQKDKTIYTLNLSEYRKTKEKNKKESDKFVDIQKDLTGLDVLSIKADIAKMEADSSRVVKVNEWHKNLKKDAYIYEAVQILEDMK